MVDYEILNKVIMLAFVLESFACAAFSAFLAHCFGQYIIIIAKYISSRKKKVDKVNIE